MDKIEICLAGDGHGAVSVIQGIHDPVVVSEIITNDEDIVNRCPSANRIADFRGSSARLIICSGYKPIIPAYIVREKDILNIHPSLLPKYRGMHSVVWAILNDEQEIGISVHRMNENIDDGPLIWQYRMENDNEKTAPQILDLLLSKVSENISNIIIGYLSGIIRPVNQDKKLATWCCKRNLDDCEIDFYASKDRLCALLRALCPPYPYPYFRYKHVKYIIKKARIREGTANAQIGRIVNIDNEGIWIESRDGYVIINELATEKGEDLPKDVFKIGSFIDSYTSNRNRL